VVSSRRSVVLSLPLLQGFPGWIDPMHTLSRKFRLLSVPLSVSFQVVHSFLLLHHSCQSQLLHFGNFKNCFFITESFKEKFILLKTCIFYKAYFYTVRLRRARGPWTSESAGGREGGGTGRNRWEWERGLQKGMEGERERDVWFLSVTFWLQLTSYFAERRLCRRSWLFFVKFRQIWWVVFLMSQSVKRATPFVRFWPTRLRTMSPSKKKKFWNRKNQVAVALNIFPSSRL